VKEKPEGGTDRSATLYAIGGYLARAGASERTIAEALKSRDVALGFRKYSERRDDTEYQRAAAKALEEASECGPSEVESEKPPAGISGPRVVRLSEVRPETVRWLWPGYIPSGKVTLLAGDPGLGKSWAALDLAARLTVGGETPDRRSRMERGAVVLLTAEDGLADTVRPRIDVQGGDASLVHVLDGIVDRDGHERLPSLIEDIEVLEQVVAANCARLVIVDPLNAYTGRTDSHVDAQVRRALTPLAKMAERTGAAVLVVMHLNQATLQPVLYRVQGSIGYVGAARSVLLVAKDKGNAAQRILAPIKANLSGEMPAIAFTITGEPALAWRGPVEADIAELLAAPSADGKGEVSKLAEALDFLEQVLGDGPVSATDVLKEAQDIGIAKRTLDRAKDQLGVIARREGESGKRGGGTWYWELPKDLECQAPHVDHGNLNPQSYTEAEVLGRQTPHVDNGVLNPADGEVF
jgi:hypothetical protein